MNSEYADRIRSSEWIVKDVLLKTAQDLVKEYHYAKGGSNTRVYCHGLFQINDENECKGVAWWIPPTKSSAEATFPENWKGVLSLSRLVIVPGVPKNACSFLLSRSIKMIDREKWPCLVTYADSWRGHSGGIYKATNWEYRGETKPQSVWVKDGIMMSRKAGPKTRTRSEMLALGAECLGTFKKHKFVLIQK